MEKEGKGTGGKLFANRESKPAAFWLLGQTVSNSNGQEPTSPSRQPEATGRRRDKGSKACHSPLSTLHAPRSSPHSTLARSAEGTPAGRSQICLCSAPAPLCRQCRTDATWASFHHSRSRLDSNTPAAICPRDFEPTLRIIRGWTFRASSAKVASGGARPEHRGNYRGGQST
jgi:hypothetical protein